MGVKKTEGDHLMRFIPRTVPIALMSAFLFSSLQADTKTQCVIITSLGGLPEYEENFTKWGNSIEDACQNEMNASVIHLNGAETKRTEILRAFENMSQSPASGDIWLFLIGHATFDGRIWRFNIKGPDLTGSDLATVV